MGLYKQFSPVPVARNQQHYNGRLFFLSSLENNKFSLIFHQLDVNNFPLIFTNPA